MMLRWPVQQKWAPMGIAESSVFGSAEWECVFKKKPFRPPHSEHRFGNRYLSNRFHSKRSRPMFVLCHSFAKWNEAKTVRCVPNKFSVNILKTSFSQRKFTQHLCSSSPYSKIPLYVISQIGWGETVNNKAKVRNLSLWALTSYVCEGFDTGSVAIHTQGTLIQCLTLLPKDIPEQQRDILTERSSARESEICKSHKKKKKIKYMVRQWQQRSGNCLWCFKKLGSVQLMVPINEAETVISIHSWNIISALCTILCKELCILNKQKRLAALLPSMQIQWSCFLPALGSWKCFSGDVYEEENSIGPPRPGCLFALFKAAPSIQSSVPTKCSLSMWKYRWMLSSPICQRNFSSQ